MLIRTKKGDIPLFFVLFLIASLFVTAISFFGLKKLLEVKSNPLKGIIQIGNQKEILPTTYLLELLEIDEEMKIDLNQLDPNELKNKLLKSDVIKWAKVEIKKNVLQIVYQTRKIRYLTIDYRNGAIDEEGFFFLIDPIFSPKKAKEIVLGKGGVTSDKRIEPWALDYLRQLEPFYHRFSLLRVDLSKAKASNFALQEIVLVLEEAKKKIYLRLHPKKIGESLNQYERMQNILQNEKVKEHQTIDLRLNSIGFLTLDS